MVKDHKSDWEDRLSTAWDSAGMPVGYSRIAAVGTRRSRAMSMARGRSEARWTRTIAGRDVGGCGDGGAWRRSTTTTSGFGAHVHTGENPKCPPVGCRRAGGSSDRGPSWTVDWGGDCGR